MATGTPHDADDDLEERLKRAPTRSGDDAAPDPEEFAELQREFGELDLDELLADPEYLDFLDSFGALEMAEDDGMALAELTEMGDAEATPAANASADAVDGSPADAVDESAASTDGSHSELVDDLIQALESDAVSDQQRAALRAALGLEDRKRLEVQLNHLKSRFLDLEAYIQAMEDLLEADTDLLAALETLRADLEALESEVETLHDRLDAADDERAALADQQADHDDDLAALADSLEETRDALRRNLSVIETELKQGRRWRQRVQAAMADTGEAAASEADADVDRD